jgi:hypothetical protein
VLVLKSAFRISGISAINTFEIERRRRFSMKRNSPFLLRLLLTTICLSAISAAQALKPVQLPPPQTTGGRP